MRPRDEEQSASRQMSVSSSTPCLHCSEGEVEREGEENGHVYHKLYIHEHFKKYVNFTWNNYCVR